jgi:hypothetical protein
MGPRTRHWGAPDAVEILFDPTERMIGFRKAKSGATTYPVRKQGKSATYLITWTALMHQMRIDTSHARRSRARMIDDVLAIDLEEAATLPSVESPQPGSG